MKKKLTKKEQINVLRLFFTISNAAFDMANKINAALAYCHNQNPPFISKMEILHNSALQEILKEDPDMDKMKKYLEQIESLAEENKLQSKTKLNHD